MKKNIKYGLISLSILIIIFFQNIFLFILVQILTIFMPITILNYSISNNNQSTIYFSYQSSNITIEKCKLSYNLYNILQNLAIKYYLNCQNAEVEFNNLRLKILQSSITGEYDKIKIDIDNIIISYHKIYFIETSNIQLIYQNNKIINDIKNKNIFFKAVGSKHLYKRDNLQIVNMENSIDIQDFTKSSIFLHINNKILINDVLKLEFYYTDSKYILNIKSNILDNSIDMTNEIIAKNNKLYIYSDLKGDIFLKQNLFEFIPKIFYNTVFQVKAKGVIEIKNNQLEDINIVGNLNNGIITELYKYGVNNSNINTTININRNKTELKGTLNIQDKLLNIEYRILDNDKIICNNTDNLFHQIKLQSDQSLKLFANNLIILNSNIEMNFNCLKDKNRSFFTKIDLSKSNIKIPFINFSNINKPLGLTLALQIINRMNKINIDIENTNINYDQILLNIHDNHIFFTIKNLNHHNTKKFNLFFYKKAAIKTDSYIKLYAKSLDAKSIKILNNKTDRKNKMKLKPNYINSEVNNKISINIDNIITKENNYQDLNLFYDQEVLKLNFIFNNYKNYIEKNNEYIRSDIKDINIIVNDLIFNYNFTSNEHLILNMKKINNIYRGDVRILNIQLNKIAISKYLPQYYLFNFISNISFQSDIKYINNNIWLEKGVLKSNFLYIKDILCDFDIKQLEGNINSKFYITPLYKILPNFISKHIFFNYKLKF